MGELKKDECGFCGKDKDMADIIISGPVVGVCNECIELLSDMIKEGKKDGSNKRVRSIHRDTSMQPL